MKAGSYQESSKFDSHNWSLNASCFWSNLLIKYPHQREVYEIASSNNESLFVSLTFGLSESRKTCCDMLWLSVAIDPITGPLGSWCYAARWAATRSLSCLRFDLFSSKLVPGGWPYLALATSTIGLPFPYRPARPPVLGAWHELMYRVFESSEKWMGIWCEISFMWWAKCAARLICCGI